MNDRRRAVEGQRKAVGVEAMAVEVQGKAVKAGTDLVVEERRRVVNSETDQLRLQSSAANQQTIEMTSCR